MESVVKKSQHRRVAPFHPHPNTMEQDRQSLLEQKRQRLQQLKQRRLGRDDTLVDQIIERLNEPKRQVSVAIQVDSIVRDTRIKREEKEKSTYDKAIQATQDDEVVTVVEPLAVVVEESVDPAPRPLQIESAAVNETQLNDRLKESIKTLNKIKTVDPSTFTDYLSTKKDTPHLNGLESPFQLTSTYKDTEMAVNSIAFSPHFPDLAIVSYASGSILSTSTTLGRAVIYSIKDTLFPEYFLEASAPITTIKFDSINPNKVIAGLGNGKIVVWDLHNAGSSSVVVLPLLTSPPYSSSLHSTYIPHTLPITDIRQLNINGNDSVISFSLEGIINTWSTNMLATPKLDSLSLNVPNSKEFSLSEQLQIQKTLFIQEEAGSSHFDDFRFLNHIVVLTPDGSIYKLSDNKADCYISKTRKLSAISDIEVLPTDDKDVHLISAHLDWSLTVWNEEPLITIPTNCIVIQIAIRPKHKYQFMTLGLLNSASKKTSIIEFWDLSQKLSGSLFQLPIDSNANTLCFSSDGKRLLIGLTDGSVAIWDTQLEPVHKHNNNEDLRLLLNKN